MAWQSGRHSTPFAFRSGTAHFSFSRTDEGFSNPFGATTLPGSQIARGSVELTPVGSAKLQFAFTDERNSTSLVDNQRQTASVQWKQPVGEKMDLTAGYDFRNFKDALTRARSHPIWQVPGWTGALPAVCKRASDANKI